MKSKMSGKQQIKNERRKEHTHTYTREGNKISKPIYLQPISAIPLGSRKVMFILKDRCVVNRYVIHIPLPLSSELKQTFSTVKQLKGIETIPRRD